MATFPQAKKVLSLLEEVPDNSLQKLLESGLLSDLLECSDPALVNREEFQQFLRGKPAGNGTIAKHTIDCDAHPFTPEGLRVVEHRKAGQLVWDPTKVVLHLSDVQKKGGVISGNDLRKLLANEQVLNANVLDYLLANQHLIPEEWKGKAVFFWGTIYRGSDGGLCVRCLRRRGGGRHWGSGWLGYGWRSGDPAARLAS